MNRYFTASDFTLIYMRSNSVMIITDWSSCEPTIKGKADNFLYPWRVLLI